MQKEKTMNSEESLLLIQRMINTAKESLDDKSFYYLLWGWFVFIACISHYILLKISSPLEGIGWIILMPLGGLITFVYSMKHERKQRTRSYVDGLMKYVLISFLVSLAIVLFFMSKLGLGTYPMVLVVYGVWLFISGGALQFRPMVIGGIINWALAIPSFFVPFDQQLIILALAVLLGYIIPGHMLKNRHRKLQANMLSV